MLMLKRIDIITLHYYYWMYWMYWPLTIQQYASSRHMHMEDELFLKQIC